MDEFDFSFCCFFVLVVLLPWALGLVFYRRIGRRKKGVHVTVGSMATLAFVIGAVWWNLFHPAIWPYPPPAQPNSDPTRVWGLYILAGAAGFGCLACGSMVLLTVLALWDRARPGTFARLAAILNPVEPPVE